MGILIRKCFLGRRTLYILYPNRKFDFYTIFILRINVFERACTNQTLTPFFVNSQHTTRRILCTHNLFLLYILQQQIINKIFGRHYQKIRFIKICYKGYLYSSISTLIDRELLQIRIIELIRKEQKKIVLQKPIAIYLSK